MHNTVVHSAFIASTWADLVPVTNTTVTWQKHNNNNNNNNNNNKLCLIG